MISVTSLGNTMEDARRKILKILGKLILKEFTTEKTLENFRRQRWKIILS